MKIGILSYYTRILESQIRNIKSRQKNIVHPL